MALVCFILISFFEKTQIPLIKLNIVDISEMNIKNTKYEINNGKWLAYIETGMQVI